MNKFIIILLLSFTLVSCANVKDKVPTLKECDGTETNKTLAEILCKTGWQSIQKNRIENLF